MPAGSIRARVRAEMIEEIKATARRHLAAEGANLSLRAVARDMGMVSSALYRYFASRDDLLTALIMDAYDALGDAVETADARVADRDDLLGRWLAAGHAIRDWALANPAEYALLFGSPVPGYAAPTDTVRAAARTPAVLVGIAADGVRAGTLAEHDPDDLPEQVRADATAIAASFSPDVPPAALTAAMLAWMSLFGAVSFELFGQLNNTVYARRELFGHHLRRLAGHLGLPAGDHPKGRTPDSPKTRNRR
ncbi:TetR/AcrR family transcriptional regulator [Plantactinospora sp. KBS50]|uniref:TetR/AcrR family transcriptional regulator n=1 Tax=Plantactinospora sp. KBS50 TaxID=2024580 RepID=UPI000BAAA327|nr:TetR/AcrR family transcriptional regulator [Plantactinospora sp. KBS50]ASW56156.1 TetR family transcriptional regulator [Plantactinospora sp. KBS50]